MVKLREKDEERARLDLADAHRQTRAADEASRSAAERARRDERQRGPALDWEIADRAQISALRDARQAEQAAAAAAQHLARKLADFVGVHGRTEALRRVVQARTAELASEAEAKERRALDEIALVRHVQSSRSSR